MKNELVIQETFGNVPSKLEFKSNFNWSILNGLRANKYSIDKSYPDELEIIKDDKYEILEKKDFLKIPDHCKFEKYLQFTKKENSNFEIVNDKYVNYLSEFLVGGGGGVNESTSFGIGSLEKTKGISSQLDYSKRSIRDYLIKNFNLESIELNNKVNYLYNRLLSIDRESLSKEIGLDNLESILNKVVIIDKKLINKNYIYKCLDKNIEHSLNIVMRRYKNYYQYGINTNDLRQDCYLYYLQRRKQLPAKWLIAKKRYFEKTNRKLTSKKFLVNTLKSYFLKRINQYLYCFYIPANIKSKFPEKTKSFQIKSNNNLFDTLRSDNAIDFSPVSRVKQASAEIIGGLGYFSEVKKVTKKELNYLDIDKTDKELSEIDRILKKDIYIDIWNLKLQGLKLSEISYKLDMSIPLIKKHSAKINNLFNEYGY